MGFDQDIQKLAAVPEFGKLTPEQKNQAMATVWAKYPDTGYSKLTSGEQAIANARVAAKYHIDLGERPEIPGSVESGPVQPAQRLKQLGKRAVEFGVGTALPMAASMAVGPEAGPVVKVGAQALAGAATPYAEYGAAKLMGENISFPTWRDAAKSAAFNAGISAIGEGVTAAAAGKGEPVAEQIENLPASARTPAQVKAAMKTRDFWLKMGMPPDEIDAVRNDPAVLQSAEAGQRYSDAFTAVKRVNSANFNQRYAAAYQGLEDAPISTKPIVDEINNIKTNLGSQRELSPTVQRWLDDKLTEFTAGQNDPDYALKQYLIKNLGLKEKQVATMTKGGLDTYRQSLTAQGITFPPTNIGTIPANEMRDFVTELHENLPKTATPVDKLEMAKVEEAAEKSFDQGMTDAGAKPEQLAAFDAIRKDYRANATALRNLDPRSEVFGTDVANELWNSAKKNPGSAIQFIKMAQEAEIARPGEVMPQLRESFLNKLMTESTLTSQGRPFEEMKALETLQKKWGGDLPTVLTGVFGKDSPIANPTTLSEVLGRLSKPDQVAADAAHSWLPFHVPRWLLNLGGAYAMYALITGNTMTSAWSDIRKNPVRFVAGMVGLMASIKFANYVYSYTNHATQQAYTDFLLNPDSNSLTKLTSLIGATGGAYEGLPQYAPSNVKSPGK